MGKRLLFLIVPLAPLAVVVALAGAPAPAGADLVCQKGVPSKPTPECERKCVVPDVRGLAVEDAIDLLREHDCDVGDVRELKRHHGHFILTRDHDLQDGHDIVIHQSDPPGSRFRRGHEVDLIDVDQGGNEGSGG